MVQSGMAGLSFAAGESQRKTAARSPPFLFVIENVISRGRGRGS